MRAIIYFEEKELYLFEFEYIEINDDNLFIFRLKEKVVALVPKNYMIVIQDKIKDV
jgi:hypothetical protein